MQRRLERLGCSASLIAHSGESALQYARSARFDLVLMDIRLQGDMDGIATAQELKNLDVPVVYVTGYSDQKTVSRAKMTEPFAYIVKPVTDLTLRSILRNLDSVPGLTKASASAG
jgi:CheY-like chemotaxis protein